MKYHNKRKFKYNKKPKFGLKYGLNNMSSGMSSWYIDITYL